MLSIQLRVDEALREKIKTEAARQNMSVNRWLIDTVTYRLEKEEEREWREGFEAMGRDPECNDVEYAVHAQAEVIAD